MPIEAQIKLQGGRIAMKLSAEKPKQLFEDIAEMQALFEAESSCGVCGGAAIKCAHRVVDENHYYSLECADPACGAQFRFGQRKGTGELFPKRKDEDGRLLDHGGWFLYRGKSESQGL